MIKDIQERVIAAKRRGADSSNWCEALRGIVAELLVEMGVQHDH